MIGTGAPAFKLTDREILPAATGFRRSITREKDMNAQSIARGAAVQASEMGARPKEKAALLTKISAMWMTRVISFAVTSGLLDALDGRRLSATDVASAVGLQSDPVQRILRALIQLDLVQESNDAFHLSEDGKRLTSNAANSLAPLATLWSGSFDAAWSKLTETAQTGRSGFELALGSPLFAYLGLHTAEARLLDGAMRSLIGLEADAAAIAIAESNPSTICDVGGGDGTLLEAVLARSPGANAILFDREDVIAATRSRGALPKNVLLRSGDFFEKIPTASIHVLANILHDWNDDDAGRILCVVAAAQPPDGLIYVIEPVLGGPDEPVMARAFDLYMLMLTGGRERSLAELEVIFAAVGYDIDHVQTLGELYRIVRAKRRS